MERVAGSGRQKCHFLNNQLIEPARVFYRNERKIVLLQNLFLSLLSKMCYFFLFTKSRLDLNPPRTGMCFNILSSFQE
jgi:hypothetical protein